MKVPFTSAFSIADLVMEIESDDRYELTNQFCPFLTKQKPDYVYQIYEVDNVNIPKGKAVYQGHGFSVIEDNEGNVYRLFYDIRKTEPYSLGIYDWAQKKISIEYSSEGRDFFKEIGNCFIHTALEELLENEKRLVFHAACADTPYGGILFAGPSGAGKSTQADLWCKYGNGHLINGDRPILRWMEKDLYAYGSPYAGSSKCYINEKCKVRAVVFVKQSETNSVRSLKISEAFRKVYASLTVHGWDTDFVKTAGDFAEKIVNEIPIYELSCTAAEGAVEALKGMLEQLE